MTGSAVTMRLIESAATRLTVVRVVMLTAAVLLSLIAWGAASASADTPLQWSSPAAVDDGAFANRISCPTATLCVAGDNNGDVMTSTNPSGGSDAWSVFPIAGEPSLVDASCLPGDGFCLVIDDNGTIWGSSTPTEFDTWSSNTEYSNGGTALAGVSCVHGTSANLGAVDQCEVAAGDSMLWSADPSDGSDADWNAEGADTTGNTLTDDSCPTISLCVATDAQGNIIYATNPEGRTWPRTNIAGTGDALVALSCPSTTFCAAVDADGNVWTTTTPTGTASAWTKTNIDDHALTGISCPSSTLCVAIDNVGNAMTSTNPTGGAFAWTLESVDPASSGLAGVSCSSNQQCVIVDNVVVNNTHFADVITGKPPVANPATPPVANPSGQPPQPTVSTLTIKESDVTAEFNGAVNPDGLPTQAHYEFGLDSEYYGGGPVTYDQSTATQNLAPGSTPQNITASVTGLVSHALYHVRLVVTSSAGTVVSADQTFTTALATAPPPPTLGQTANLTPTSGIVLVKLPGGKSPYSLARPALSPLPTKGLGFIPVTQARQVPVGSEIDSLRGTLDLVVSNGQPHHTQKAHLKGAIYTVSQTRTGPHKGLTTFTLKENAFAGAPTYSSCTSKKKSAEAAAVPFSKKPKLSTSILQTLRATDNHGKFSTRGRYSAATVRGTDWGVEDRCDGTLTLVHRGTVNVFDFATRKTIAVHAGHSFLAGAVAAGSHGKTKKNG
jgi:hypothetical protein